MSKIFLDTNVIISSVVLRDDSESANAILTASDNGKINVCISFLTVANAAYILKKGRTTNEMKELLRETIDGITILPMDGTLISDAYKIDAPDFEDVLQYECAKAGGCDVIITSNIKHFKFVSDIKVISSNDYAQQFIGDND